MRAGPGRGPRAGPGARGLRGCAVGAPEGRAGPGSPLLAAVRPGPAAPRAPPPASPVRTPRLRPRALPVPGRPSDPGPGPSPVRGAAEQRTRPFPPQRARRLPLLGPGGPGGARGGTESTGSGSARGARRAGAGRPRHGPPVAGAGGAAERPARSCSQWRLLAGLSPADAGQGWSCRRTAGLGERLRFGPLKTRVFVSRGWAACLPSYRRWHPQDGKFWPNVPSWGGKPGPANGRVSCAGGALLPPAGRAGPSRLRASPAAPRALPVHFPVTANGRWTEQLCCTVNSGRQTARALCAQGQGACSRGNKSKHPPFLFLWGAGDVCLT